MQDPEGVIDEEAVEVVDNVLVLVVAHHNDLVDDQLLCGISNILCATAHAFLGCVCRFICLMATVSPVLVSAVYTTPDAL